MDSPKHIGCLDDGADCQFYRLAGQNRYKCKSCGVIKGGSYFKDIEFQWRTNADAWKVWRKEQASEVSKRKEKIK